MYTILNCFKSLPLKGHEDQVTQGNFNFAQGMCSNLFQFSIHQNDPTALLHPGKAGSCKQPLNSTF